MKKPKKEKLVLVNIKIAPDELRRLKAIATIYTNGNLSQWLRWAGSDFKPARPRMFS